MAHPEQKQFCLNIKSKFPDRFKNTRVLDIGSQDLNGNNRFLFENSQYIGIDVGEGRNVDIVCVGHEFKTDEKFPLIITTEAMEHDMYIDKTLKNITENLLADNGLFLFTCGSRERGIHGTIETSPSCSPLTSKIPQWQSYYRGLDECDIREMMDVDLIFKDYYFEKFENKNTQDLYFYGIKK
jgi:hypothetical protein